MTSFSAPESTKSLLILFALIFSFLHGQLPLIIS
jgi:hypothetical protein